MVLIRLRTTEENDKLIIPSFGVHWSPILFSHKETLGLTLSVHALVCL